MSEGAGVNTFEFPHFRGVRTLKFANMCRKLASEIKYFETDGQHSNDWFIQYARYS